VCKHQEGLRHIFSKGKLWKSELFCYKVRHLPVYVSLEAFVATEFNEMFTGRKLRQDVKVFQHFRDVGSP
jgi:hypothetical protein